MSEWSYDIFHSADTIDVNEWNNLLDHSEFSSFYNEIGWLAALEQDIGGRPHHIVVTKDGSPTGLLPGFVVPIQGTPFSRLVSVNPGYGNPVLTGDKERTLEELFSAISDVCSGTTVSHTMRADRLLHLSLNGYLDDIGYRLTVGGKFVLSLDRPWETILEDMHKDRRYNIRRGHESDAEVREVDLDDGKNVQDFYDDYSQKMDHLGASQRSSAFFETLFDRMQDDMKLLTVFADGDRRGYHLYHLDRYRSRIHHHIVTVTPDDYDYYSGELMHDHAIKWGLENGWEEYDFGGNNADFRTGGYRYKKQYGGDLLPSYRWEREYSRLFKVGRFVARRISVM